MEYQNPQSNFKTLLSSTLQTNRPHLTPSSIKTYTSVLFNLHKHMGGNRTNIDWFYTECENILDYLKQNAKKSTRKSILSALYVLTKLPQFQEQMMKDAKDIHEEYKEQKKTEKQKENWLSVKEIEDKYHKLLRQVQDIFKKKAIADISIIIDYLLVGFLSGHLFPPRRNLDYALLKWKNYNKNEDNYYKNGKFYFNKYKTSDTYGLAKVDVPKELDSILKKWLKINPSDYVLISSNNKPLSSSQITKMLNKIFGKEVSVNMLRHIYLSNYYKGMPKLSNMEELASSMGHNVQTALENYVKID